MLNPPAHQMRWWVAHLTPRELSIQLEWRLSSEDVGLLLGCTRFAVNHYTRKGRGGHILHSRIWGKKGSKRVYRLSNVEEFARLQGWTLDYTTLPMWVQKEWKVGPYNPDNKPGHDAAIETLAHLKNREKPCSS